MDIQLLMTFCGASVLLTIMPGPDNLFVLTESVTKGARNGIALSTGLASGVLVHTILAATGLSIILQNSDVVFQVVKYFGVAYLLYLAFMATKEKPQTINLDGKVDQEDFSFWKLSRTGFLMNILNPKVTLFFVAFLPQFVAKTGFSPTLQMLIMGLIFMLQAWLLFSLLALLSGQLSTYLNHPRFWTVTKWTKVLVLALLGIFLAFTGK